MRHVTLTCPQCVEPDKAVGDPSEEAHGWIGAWYCFHCHAKGNYAVRFEVSEQPEPDAAA